MTTPTPAAKSRITVRAVRDLCAAIHGLTDHTVRENELVDYDAVQAVITAAGFRPADTRMAEPASPELRARLATSVASKIGDADSILSAALEAALFDLDLTVVPVEHIGRAMPGRSPQPAEDAAMRPAWTQPMVTVSGLFDRAATAAENGDPVDLLDIVAALAPSPALHAYRAVISALRSAVVEDAEQVKALEEVADGLRVRVFEALVRGPDAPQTTGREEF